MQRCSRKAVVARGFTAGFALAITLLSAGGQVDPVAAQTTAPPAAPRAFEATLANDLQRAVEIFGYDVAGKAGASRGEVFYYFKCWVCHNDFTIAAGSPAPTLKGLFQRPISSPATRSMTTPSPTRFATAARRCRPSDLPQRKRHRRHARLSARQVLLRGDEPAEKPLVPRDRAEFAGNAARGNRERRAERVRCAAPMAISSKASWCS